MATHEGLEPPGGNTPVSGEGLDRARTVEELGSLAGARNPEIAKPVRFCIECRQPLKPGERKLCRGACQHAREIRLQRLRRGRRRRW